MFSGRFDDDVVAGSWFLYINILYDSEMLLHCCYILLKIEILHKKRKANK